MDRLLNCCSSTSTYCLQGAHHVHEVLHARAEAWRERVGIDGDEALTLCQQSYDIFCTVTHGILVM